MVKMEVLDRVNPSDYVAPYIVACYDDYLFCDLVFICAGNQSVSCHKLVLCSLSKKLLEICKDGEEAGETSYIHLPDFSLEDVKRTLDEVYASILKKKVEIHKTEVISVLGIEDAQPKPPLIIPLLTLKTEAKVEELSDYGGDFEGNYYPDVEMDVSDNNVEEEDTTKESLSVVKYNEYHGTRSQYWKEDYVKNTLAVSIHKICLPAIREVILISLIGHLS